MAMSTSSGSGDYGLFDELAEEFAERVPPRRAALAPGIHRPLPGDGRRDPRALPGAGRGRAGRGGPGTAATDRPPRHPPRRCARWAITG